MTTGETTTGWGDWHENAARAGHDLEEEYRHESEILGPVRCAAIVQKHVAARWTEQGITSVTLADIRVVEALIRASITDAETAYPAPTLPALQAWLRRMPPIERAQLAGLLADARTTVAVAAVRREAVYEATRTTPRAVIAEQLGVSQQAIGKAITEHRRTLLGDGGPARPGKIPAEASADLDQRWADAATASILNGLARAGHQDAVLKEMSDADRRLVEDAIERHRAWIDRP